MTLPLHSTAQGNLSDNLVTGNRENLAGLGDRVPLVQADVCDVEADEKALRDNDVDVVVHFAAESHNSLAVLDPGLFFRTNVLGTQTMLQAARDAGVDRFHHISTCEVYGDLPLDAGLRLGQVAITRARIQAGLGMLDSAHGLF